LRKWRNHFSWGAQRAQRLTSVVSRHIPHAIGPSFAGKPPSFSQSQLLPGKAPSQEKAEIATVSSIYARKLTQKLMIRGEMLCFCAMNTMLPPDNVPGQA
jgi:hypothetical protein